MAMTCPNKATREWKMLEKQVGPTLANLAYVSNNYNIPDVRSITEIKKELGFTTYVENLGPIAGKIKRYNQKYGTSHYFVSEKAYGNTFKLALKLNYLSINIEKQRQRQANRNEIYRVEEYNREAFGKLYGRIEPAYTPSPTEREAGRFNEEGDFIPIDDEDFMIEGGTKQVSAVEKERRKRIETEITLTRRDLSNVEDRVSHRLLVSKLAKLRNELEKSEQRIGLADKIKAYEKVLEYADAQLSEIEKILELSNINYGDIFYAQKATNLWRAAGDFSVAPGLHIILDEDERNTPEIRQMFKARQDRAESLGKKLNVLIKDRVEDFVREYTHEDLTSEEIGKNLKDINKVASLTKNLGRTGDAVLQALFGAVETANTLAQNEANEVWEQLDDLGKKVLPKLRRISSERNPFGALKQLTKNGNETGRLVTRYSAEYFDTLNTLVSNAFHKRDPRTQELIKNKRDIDAYFKWLDNNTISMDVRLLFPDTLSSEDTTTPKDILYKRVSYSDTQKADHIAELKRQLGEKGFEKYMERLEKKIEKWKMARESTWDSIQMEEELSEKEKRELFEAWDREYSPYWALDMAQNPASRRKPDGGYYSPKGLRDYTYQVPRRITKDGKRTEWYDKNFEKIEADKDLLAFHDLITDLLYQLKFLFPKSKQRLLGLNILPTIQKTLMDEYSEKGMMMGIIPFWDKMKSLQTTTDLSKKDYSIEDPLTKTREKQLPTQFIDDTNARVRDIVTTKLITYRQENPDKKLTAKDVFNLKKKFREEAKDYLSKQKSWDLIKIMKAYSIMALAYKHKSFIEPQIRLAEQIFKNKREIITNKAEQPLTDEEGVVSTKDGLKNYKEMLDFFLDSTYYGYGAREIEGPRKKKLYSKEEKKQKEELETALEAATDEKEKEFLQEQLDALGGVRSASGIGDTVLKFMTYKGLGWNIFSAVSNIGFGMISNWIEAADGRNYTQKQMRKAYLLTVNSIGKNLTFNTWGGINGNAIKIRTLMDQWDLLKTSNRELFNMSNKSSFGKGLKRFGPFSPQERSEYLNYAPAMIAVMMTFKAKNPEGKTIELWEAYGKDGKLKPGYTTDVDEISMVRKIRRVIEMNHGDYNNPLMIKKKLWGRAISQFRTWMFEGFASRFEAEKVDYALSYGLDEPFIRKGRYRSYTAGQMATAGAVVGSTILPGIGTAIGAGIGYLGGRFFGMETEQNGISDTLFTLKQLLRKLVFKSTQFDTKYNKVDAANMRKNMNELYIYVALVGFSLALRALTVDEDDEDETWFITNFLLNQSTRLQTDIALYTNPLELEKLTQTAIPATQLLMDVTEWLGDVTNFFDDDPKNEVYQGGPFKGESKFWIHTGEMLPGTSQVIRLYRLGDRVIDKK